MKHYPLTDMAVKMFCPDNVVKIDDLGMPSIMVYIPKFKNSDVLTGGDDNTHPAFIVNDTEIDGFYYSKYQNIVCNGMACSLPGEDPAVNISFNSALGYCEGKGYGWHLCTIAEWAAIALWCKANGFQPYGNNNNGKDTRESEYKAITTATDTEGKTTRVATGTGPLSWSHNRTASGIWDMNGNVWELQSGIRFVWGELQLLANNDAADFNNPQNETSTCWKAINATTGAMVEPECKPNDKQPTLSGRTVRIDFVSNIWTYSTEITTYGTEEKTSLFWKLTCTGDISEAAKTVLRTLALLPEEGAIESDYEGDSVWLNNTAAERIISRGGSSINGKSYGVFSLAGHIGRSATPPSFGFRAAYIPGII